MRSIKPKNILVLTYWSYRDALVQTYTLPYVRLIKQQLPAQSEIYLVTLEQSQLSLSEADARLVREELKREGIRLVAFNYSKRGVHPLRSNSVAIALKSRDRFHFVPEAVA